MSSCIGTGCERDRVSAKKRALLSRRGCFPRSCSLPPYRTFGLLRVACVFGGVVCSGKEKGTNPRKKKSPRPQSTRSSAHRRRATLRAASKLPACSTLGCSSGPAKLGRGAERPGRARRPLPSSGAAVPQQQAGAAAAALPLWRPGCAAPRTAPPAATAPAAPALRAGPGRQRGPAGRGRERCPALPELPAAPSPRRAKSGRRDGSERGLSPVRRERRTPDPAAVCQGLSASAPAGPVTLGPLVTT